MKRQPKGKPTGGQFASGDTFRSEAGQVMDEYARERAAGDPHISPEQLDKALIDERLYVREAAVKNPAASERHYSQALRDHKPQVRELAAERTHDPANIDMALRDPDACVRAAAARNTVGSLDATLDAADYRMRLTDIVIQSQYGKTT